MRPYPFVQLFAAAIALWCATARIANAQDLVFASVETAARVLAARDDFVARLSPFDRAARLKTDRAVTEREFLEFAAAAALPWQPEERAAIETAMRAIQPVFVRLGLPLPPRVHLVKTSGREEGGAAYTRADAIVLPAKLLGLPERDMRRLLAHELFHVASRAAPQLARPLYETIGFHRCGEAAYPAELAQRRITNPDAPRNDYCVQVRIGGDTAWVVPILYSSAPKYDPARGGEFFNYLRLGFLGVDGPDGKPAARRGQVTALEDLSGFFEQIGRNTDEFIHPEEIVADNVALLAIGERNVKSPDVLARIEAALAKAAPRN